MQSEGDRRRFYTEEKRTLEKAERSRVRERRCTLLASKMKEEAMSQGKQGMQLETLEKADCLLELLEEVILCRHFNFSFLRLFGLLT